MAEPVNHHNYEAYNHEEYFKFSADGKFTYVRRVFEGGIELFWKYETVYYPLEDGEPTSRRAYSRVQAAESRSI